MQAFQGTLSTPDGRILGLVRGYVDPRGRAGGFDRGGLSGADALPDGDLRLSFNGGQQWSIRIEAVEGSSVRFRAPGEPPR